MNPIAKEFRISSSSVHHIMADAKGKSNLERYNAAKLSFSKDKSQYEALTNKTTKTAKALLVKIRKNEAIVRDLEDKKDIPHLSVGCKTFLKKWLKSKMWARKEEFENKYTSKGNKTEEDGITLIARVLKTGFIKKNAERFFSEYQEGEPDVLVKKELVIDNKSSYSLDTFPMYDNELPDKKYDWQVTSYMALTGAKEGMVCYTLNDMPDDMLQDQIDSYVMRSEMYKGKTPTPDEMYEFIKLRVFTQEKFDSWKGMYVDAEQNDFIEIPLKKRVKSFKIERDEEKISAIDTRVIECRKYLDYLLKQEL